MQGCPKCEKRQYVVDAVGEYAQAQVCECSRQCRKCEGKRMVPRTVQAAPIAGGGTRTYEVLGTCECVHLGRRVALFNAARVPKVLAHATLDNFERDCREQGQALAVAQTLIAELRERKPTRGLLIAGPVGTGKTHLLAGCLRELTLELGVGAQYVEISLLYAAIRRGFNEGKSGGEIIEPISAVPVLAIDELGKGRGSQFEMDTLEELIARRYNAGRTTLFTTNHALEKPGPRAGGYRSTQDSMEVAAERETLAERVGERTFSRLHEMCAMVALPASLLDRRRRRVAPVAAQAAQR